MTDQLVIIPQTYYLIRHISRRYGCVCKQCLKTASKPPAVLPGTPACVQLIAHAMVSNYLGGLPLYRQENVAARNKIELPRAKLTRWIVDTGERHLQPIFNLIQEV